MTTRNEAAERLRELILAIPNIKPTIYERTPDGPESVAPFDPYKSRALLDEALAAAKAEGAREASGLLKEVLAYPFLPKLAEGRALLQKIRSFLQAEREYSLGYDAEGHLVLTLGPGAESPSRKGERE